MNLFAIAEVLPRLKALWQSTVDHHARLVRAGVRPTRDLLSAHIEGEAVSWNPVVMGLRPLADPDTKAAGARFFAGLVFDFVEKGA